ncbi:uncharacterized protein Tco025E_08774 [Trypanosoma conorhini]|uniref:Uncharacterized protein n=1 Tax=Trypanosoma conorhini TaxID=83891 RepID=A0A422N4Z4_9TRYP|nr:uncharacterized protein Tco025E_08774 [Trypanosoma conorhini]RNF00539.1 hypothetical protein Tco025E_08774 [Trypanosoma conorhini]
MPFGFGHSGVSGGEKCDAAAGKASQPAQPADPRITTAPPGQSGRSQPHACIPPTTRGAKGPHWPTCERGFCADAGDRRALFGPVLRALGRRRRRARGPAWRPPPSHGRRDGRRRQVARCAEQAATAAKKPRCRWLGFAVFDACGRRGGSGPVAASGPPAAPRNSPPPTSATTRAGDSTAPAKASPMQCCPAPCQCQFGPASRHRFVSECGGPARTGNAPTPQGGRTVSVKTAALVRSPRKHGGGENRLPLRTQAKHRPKEEAKFEAAAEVPGKLDSRIRRRLKGDKPETASTIEAGCPRVVDLEPQGGGGAGRCLRRTPAQISGTPFPFSVAEGPRWQGRMVWRGRGASQASARGSLAVCGFMQAVGPRPSGRRLSRNDGPLRGIA